MEPIIIDVAGCSTALQLLSRINKALGIKSDTFSALYHHLTITYYPGLIFRNMDQFREHCPHAAQELQVVLKRVQWHYETMDKKFEYDLGA